MNKKTPVPAYKLLSNPSNKLKLFINHYESPCTSKELIPLGPIYSPIFCPITCYYKL